ncbi:MAG: CDP-alcohol phosphatidyltransferase family protein [Candidatus Latescibacteria bacterium]|nr:CDP-alcohol phosphatidyltransferase family protein [Candidatus Latescibacterota bacterium]
MKVPGKVDNLNPANILTFLRIALVPLYVWLFSLQQWYTVVIALIVFIVAAVTDLYDGRLARSRKEITKLGKFLDPLADKFLVVGALAQFCVMGLVSVWLVSVIIIRDVWVTVMRIVAIARGTELRTSRDAKVKTAIQLTAVITIIVFTGARIIALKLGYSGPLIDPGGYRLFFNGLLSVAVLFTIYSWAGYLFRKKAA